MDLTWQSIRPDTRGMQQFQSRFGFSSATLVGGKIVMFGGTIGGVGAGRNNFMFVFDINSATWSKVQCGDESLPRRTMHTSVLVDDQLLIYGGLDEWGYRRELISFDMIVCTWKRIELRGNAPGTSAGHSGEYFKHRDSMLLFLGFNGKYYSQLFEFNLSSEFWQKLTPKGEKPSPRFKQGTALIGYNWFLYGGDTLEDGSSNQLYVLNTKPLQPVWSRIKATEHAMPPNLMAPIVTYKGKILIYNPHQDRTSVGSLYLYYPEEERFIHFLEADKVQEAKEKNRLGVSTDHKIRGTFPPDRKAHMVVSNGEKVFVFGGYHESLAGMYTLEPSREIQEEEVNG